MQLQNRKRAISWHPKWDCRAQNPSQQTLLASVVLQREPQSLRGNPPKVGLGKEPRAQARAMQSRSWILWGRKEAAFSDWCRNCVLQGWQNPEINQPAAFQGGEARQSWGGEAGGSGRLLGNCKTPPRSGLKIVDLPSLRPPPPPPHQTPAEAPLCARAGCRSTRTVPPRHRDGERERPPPAQAQGLP